MLRYKFKLLNTVNPQYSVMNSTWANLPSSLMPKRLTHVNEFSFSKPLSNFIVYQFFQIEPPENSREKAVWNRANKPPTPEPEPEAEVDEAAEGEEAVEGEEAEGEATEETPEEGAPTDYPEGELEEVSF